MGETSRLKSKRLIKANRFVKDLYACSYCGGTGRLRGPKGQFKAECPVCGGTGIEILSKKDFIDRVYNIYLKTAEEISWKVRQE